jgi:short subunit dehydrogenase-like uncharacterized protein
MKILLVGAYGYTGKLICQLLQENEVEFNIAGRNEIALASTKASFSAIQKYHALDIAQDDCLQIISEYDLFVNCAGPFTEESAIFVQAIATTANKYYLDISGEVGYVQKSIEDNHLPAYSNNTRIIHSCAFESLVADLLFKSFRDEFPAIKSIKTFYRFDRSRPSPGTRITMKLSKFRELNQITNGSWKQYSTNSIVINTVENVKYTAVPYPLPEIALFHRNSGAQNISSHLLLPAEEAIFVRPHKKVEGNIQDELKNLRLRKRPGAGTEERAKQVCEIYLEIESDSHSIKRVKAEAKDMYLITAKCILFSILSLKTKETLPFGVIDPADLFMGEEKDILKALGFEVSSIHTING